MKQLTHDRRFITILLVVFVQMVGASLVIPILPLFAKREFALDERLIPLLISAFFAAQFVAGPWIGRLSDRYGRVPVLIISQIGTVIAFCMLGSATSAWWLLLGRLLDGVTGGNIIVAQAYITDIFPKEKRTEALGYIMAAIGSGFFIGPALGGILSGYLGTRAPFWLAAIAAAVVVLLTWFTLDESRTPEQMAEAKTKEANNEKSLSLGMLLGYRPIAIILSIAFAFQVVMGMMQATLALWGAAVIFEGMPQRTVDLGVGAIFSTFGITQIVIQTFLLRPLLQRYQEQTLFVIGTILRTVSTFMLAIVWLPWQAYASAVVLSLGMGIVLPTMQSIGTKMVDENVRGEMLGYLTSASNLGVIIGTASAGLLFQIEPSLQFWVGGFIMIGVVLLAVQLQRVTIQPLQIDRQLV